MRRVTLVKKRLADGSLCQKCGEVDARMRKNGHDAWIDRVLIADEHDTGGEAWQLAREHGIVTAPFFVVEEDGATRVHTIYLKFIRDLRQGAAEHAGGPEGLPTPAVARA